jgi:hypothetical protein
MTFQVDDRAWRKAGPFINLETNLRDLFQE